LTVIGLSKRWKVFMFLGSPANLIAAQSCGKSQLFISHLKLREELVFARGTPSTCKFASAQGKPEENRNHSPR
jgi:hypothetical protein